MEEHKEVTVSGKLTFDDFKKHNRYHQSKWNALLILVSLLLFSLLFSYAMSGTWFLVAIVSLMLGSIFAGILWLLLKLIVFFRVKREYYSDSLIKSEMYYTVNSTGIEQKVRRSHTYFTWNDIRAVYEHKDLFQLYVSRNKAIVLPKRYFQSKEQLDLFKSIVSEHVSSKKVRMFPSL